MHPLWDSTCTAISVSPSEKKVMENKSSKMFNQAYLHKNCIWVLQPNNKKCLLPLWFGTFRQIFSANKKFTWVVNAGRMFTLCVRHKKQEWSSEKGSHLVVIDTRTLLLPGISMVHLSKTFLANNIFLTPHLSNAFCKETLHVSYRDISSSRAKIASNDVTDSGSSSKVLMECWWYHSFCVEPMWLRVLNSVIEVNIALSPEKAYVNLWVILPQTTILRTYRWTGTCQWSEICTVLLVRNNFKRTIDIDDREKDMIFTFLSFIDFCHASHFLTMGTGSGEDPNVTTVLFLSMVGWRETNKIEVEISLFTLTRRKNSVLTELGNCFIWLIGLTPLQWLLISSSRNTVF